MAERFGALVLRQVDVGEADRILTLLTAEQGRIDVRASGARRSKRFAGLDLFVAVDVALVPGRRPLRLAEAEVRRDFAGLKGDLLALALASYAAELLRQASREDDPAPDLYRLGLAAFESLEADSACAGWARAFELKLLHVVGNRPSLRRCAATGEPAEEPLGWSPTIGGILCGEGLAEDPAARHLDLQTVNLLDQSLRTPLSDQGEVPWTDRATRQASDAMRSFLDAHIAAPGKAWRFLQGVLPLLLIGCLGCTAAPDGPVRVQGWVYSTPTPGDDAELRVAGVDGVAWDDDGVELGDGSRPFSDFPEFLRFSDLPQSSAVHLALEPAADAALPTVVSGRSAPGDLYVNDGVFHVLSRAAVDIDLAAWTGLAPIPPLDPEVRGGGFVQGRVLNADDFVGLRLVVTDADGRAWDAAYLDAEGLPSSEPGLTTDGGFYACCPSEGPIEVLLLEGDAQVGEGFTSRAVEDGATSLPFVELR